MSWSEALEPTLEQTLSLILQSLANFFGTTTEAIMANAPGWLAKYGWYVTLHNDFVGWLFGGLFAGSILAACFLMVWSCTNHEIKPIQVGIAIFFFFLGAGIVISIPIVTCMIAPEIVGLEAAIKLIS